MKNHMLDLLRFKTFTVQQASRESRKLFDLCVAGARNGKPPETAGDVEFARIDVSMEELFEMRVPFVKMLNAADLALGLYKTGAVNQAVVCENMIGNFWRAGKGGTREKTKMFEALELYKNEQLLAETLPNLVHFMDQINTGRCPRPRYLLTRFGEKIASATLNFFDQIWRRVAAQDLG